ncbi:MAG: hypothetical protein ACM3S2_12195 [Ignavibacteriales bacterium]
MERPYQASLKEQNASPPGNIIFIEPGEEEIQLTSATDFLRRRIHESGNELGVLKAIYYTLSTNSDIITAQPDFVNIRQAFCEYTDRLIFRYSEAKEKLISTLLRIADSIRNYGVMTENSELIIAASVKENSLKKMEDNQLVETGKSILRYIDRYALPLHFMGVQQYSLNVLESDIEQFSYTTGIGKTEVFEKTEWKREIDEIYDNIYNVIHNKLDRLMEQMRERYPRFYHEYLQSKSLHLAV